MDNINNVTFELIESKAKLYNKPKALVKPDSQIHVIDCTQAKKAGEAAVESSMGPMARIAALEAKVAGLMERVEELEEIVTKVLIA